MICQPSPAHLSLVPVSGIGLPKVLERPPHRIIRCKRCKRFLMEIELAMPRAPIGPIVKLKDVKCAGCGWKDEIDFGIAEGGSAERLEKKLEQSRT